MEHLSRRNLRLIDHLVLVADPSPRGMAAARGIAELAAALSLPVGRTWLLINRPYAPGDKAAAGDPPAPLLADVPHDPSLGGWEAERRSFLDIPAASPAASAIAGAVRTLLSWPPR